MLCITFSSPYCSLIKIYLAYSTWRSTQFMIIYELTCKLPIVNHRYIVKITCWIWRSPGHYPGERYYASTVYFIISTVVYVYKLSLENTVMAHKQFPLIFNPLQLLICLTYTLVTFMSFVKRQNSEFVEENCNLLTRKS